jgi:hypothetical protein
MVKVTNTAEIANSIGLTGFMEMTSKAKGFAVIPMYLWAEEPIQG